MSAATPLSFLYGNEKRPLEDAVVNVDSLAYVVEILVQEPLHIAMIGGVQIHCAI